MGPDRSARPARRAGCPFSGGTSTAGHAGRAVRAYVDVLHTQPPQPVGVDALEINVPFLPLRVIKGSASAPSASCMARGTSSSVSKQQLPMAGQEPPEILWPGAVYFLHPQCGFGSQPHGGATPPGVYGGNAAAHRVMQQDSAAVGGKHHQRKPGTSVIMASTSYSPGAHNPLPASACVTTRMFCEWVCWLITVRCQSVPTAAQKRR